MHLGGSHNHPVCDHVPHLVEQQASLELRFELRRRQPGLRLHLTLVGLHTDEDAVAISPGNGLQRHDQFRLGDFEAQLPRLDRRRPIKHHLIEHAVGKAGHHGGIVVPHPRLDRLPQLLGGDVGAAD